MNIILILLAIIITPIILVLVIALFSKKEYSIERSIIINRPVQEVFSYLKYLKNQDHFSQWVKMDPNMKKTYSGTDGTAGFVYAWDGNKKAGAGEQEIIKIEEGRRLDIEVRFIRPFKGVAYTPFITEPLSENQTKVIWGMNNKMKFPMNAFLLFQNVNKMLGGPIETSLKDLKSILEDNKYI